MAITAFPSEPNRTQSNSFIWPYSTLPNQGFSGFLIVRLLEWCDPSLLKWKTCVRDETNTFLGVILFFYLTLMKSPHQESWRWTFLENMCYLWYIQVVPMKISFNSPTQSQKLNVKFLWEWYLTRAQRFWSRICTPQFPAFRLKSRGTCDT